MGSYSYESTISSSIPPARIFKAYLLDGKKFLPKVMPDYITATEVLQGDGGPGTLYLIHFGEGHPSKTAKLRVDVLDKDNLIFKVTVVEADGFRDVLESISHDFKIEAAANNGGSVVKVTTIYNSKVEIAEDKLKELEAEVKKGEEKGEAIVKAVEAYLLAHPDEYID